MSFFHLRTLPGYSWPALPDAGLSQIWVVYQELNRTQWLSPPDFERWQMQQIRSLLFHAMANVPYYRRMFQNVGISPENIHTMEDFRCIPFLLRRRYQENLETLTATKLPDGTLATGTGTTSGTSGTPITVLQTNIVGLWWCACYLRDLEWCGIDPTGTLAVIRPSGKTGAQLAQLMEGISAASWIPELQALIETGPMYGMDVAQDPRRQIEWLQRCQPDYLLANPSVVELLASIMQETGQSLANLRAIQVIAESLEEDSRSRIESVFGVPVKNTYSCAEAGYVASPCPGGQGFHVHAEHVLVEVLDEKDRPCSPGQTGRVYLTTLHNYRAPFIRYDVGDEATLGAGPCPCGRGLPWLSKVYGKKRPMFPLSNGQFKNTSLIAEGLRKIGGHHQHQVVQKKINHVVVRLVPDSTWSPGHEVRIRSMLQEFFEDTPQIEVLIQDRLDLPQGGKLQSMICEVE